MSKVFITIFLGTMFAMYSFVLQPNTEQNQPGKISCDITVERVVDGDTIVAKDSCKSESETIRILGINTPETVSPKVDDQCYGKEASQFVKEAIEGQKIALIADSKATTDRYGRLLRYVEFGRSDFGLALIQQGYAEENGYGTKYDRQEKYKTATFHAQANKIGMWENCYIDKIR